MTVPVPAEFVMTQLADHVNIRSISQLIKGISKDFPEVTNVF